MNYRSLLSMILLAVVVVFAAGCQPATQAVATTAPQAQPTSQVQAEAPTSPPLPEPTAAKPEEQITLNVWIIGQEAPIDPNKPTYPEKISKGFTAKYPNVKVQWSFYSFDDLNRSLRLALDGHTGPDVANSTTGLVGTDAYAAAGHLVDLSDVAKERGWDKHYSKDLLTFANISAPGQKTFGVPTLSSTVGVYYNPEIFDKYGLKVPTTFAEFEQILATLKSNGVTPFSVGGLDQWPLGHYWEQLIHLTVPFEDLSQLYILNDKATFDSPGMVQAAKIVEEWAKKGYFQDNYLGTNFADGNNVFINGQSAMNVGGTWELAEFSTLPKFQAHFFPMPPMNPDMPWHVGGQAPDNNWVVSKYSQHQEAAINFVDYVLGEESAKFIWEEGNIPNYKFDTPLPPITVLQGEVYAAMQKTGPGYYMGVTPEVLQAEGTLLQQLCKGDITPEQAMADLQKAYLEGIKNMQ